VDKKTEPVYTKKQLSDSIQKAALITAKQNKLDSSNVQLPKGYGAKG